MSQQAFPFRAVIFDMDGVIVDTEKFYQDELRAFSEENGFGVTDAELDALVGTSHQTFRRVNREWWAAAGRDVTLDEAEAIYEAWAADRPCDYRSIMNPGVHDTLAELRARGVTVALASSSPMANIKRVLGECGLSDAFEVMVSGEQFVESKPEPDIYLHALELLGMDASECCCVEDSVPGITAGKRAGLTVIAKREDRFGFSQDAADVVIDQIPDLLDVTR